MEVCRTNSKQCLVGVCTRCRVNPCGLDVFRRRVTLSFRNQKVVTNRFVLGRKQTRMGGTGGGTSSGCCLDERVTGGVHAFLFGT